MAKKNFIEPRNVEEEANVIYFEHQYSHHENHKEFITKLVLNHMIDEKYDMFDEY